MPVPDAALQILAAIFGVTQFSKVIRDLTPEHREMVAFWMQYARENQKLLLESGFIPYEPHFLYPIIKAYTETEEIIAIYAMNKLLHPDLRKNRVHIINATKEAKCYLRVDCDAHVKLTRRDCRGRIVSQEEKIVPKGICTMEISRSRLPELTKIIKK